MPRSGDVQTGFSDDGDGVEVEGYSGFTSKAENRQQKGGLQLERKAQLGRFQWVTNDEGVANFLQRPPSRQKDAFPTHLADVIPYAAFQVSPDSSLFMPLLGSCRNHAFCARLVQVL